MILDRFISRLYRFYRWYGFVSFRKKQSVKSVQSADKKHEKAKGYSEITDDLRECRYNSLFKTLKRPIKTSLSPIKTLLLTPFIYHFTITIPLRKEKTTMKSRKPYMPTKDADCLVGTKSWITGGYALLRRRLSTSRPCGVSSRSLF
jgi:hypothetical protein